MIPMKTPMMMMTMMMVVGVTACRHAMCETRVCCNDPLLPHIHPSLPSVYDDDDDDVGVCASLRVA
jgi:hypothetical protein